MVTVYIGGGLANKMFQYAFSLAIKKMGYEVDYDVQTFKTEFAYYQISLQSIFLNVKINESSVIKYSFAGKNGKFDRLVKRFSPYYIVEHAYLYNENVWKQMRNRCYIESSWQDENYFITAESDVRNAFQFPAFEDERNIEVAEDMAASNSVAIHIRKGDGYGTWNIFSNTCPKEYYFNAIRYIKEHVDNPKFYVFSDSTGVVQQYLGGENFKLIDWNPTVGKGNYLDMQLMSSARQNVIANSTYSWWGAWLNSNVDKIVVGPRFWFNPECKLANINHIIPNRWVKL